MIAPNTKRMLELFSNSMPEHGTVSQGLRGLSDGEGPGVSVPLCQQLRLLNKSKEKDYQERYTGSKDVVLLQGIDRHLLHPGDLGR